MPESRLTLKKLFVCQIFQEKRLDKSSHVTFAFLFYPKFQVHLQFADWGRRTKGTVPKIGCTGLQILPRRRQYLRAAHWSKPVRAWATESGQRAHGGGRADFESPIQRKMPRFAPRQLQLPRVHHQAQHARCGENRRSPRKYLTVIRGTQIVYHTRIWPQWLHF